MKIKHFYPRIDYKMFKKSLDATFSGLRGAEEVDEAEDYEAPGSNPGQEI